MATWMSGGRGRWWVLLAGALVALPGGLAAAAAGPPEAGETIPSEARLAAGPWTVTRGTGKPAVEAFSFAACDPTGRFWLKLVNGVGGKPAVASAAVRVNEGVVFDPSAFNANPATLAGAVVIRSGDNRVEVEARGAPGGTMEIAVWAIQRCLRVELPPAPPGGYMPPDPVRWGDTIFLRGRVESASPWWVEVCKCEPQAGNCVDLDPASVKPVLHRRADWFERTRDQRLGAYCGPEPPPASSRQELEQRYENAFPPGWWSVGGDEHHEYATQTGTDTFGVFLTLRPDEPWRTLGWTGVRQYLILVFNLAGDRTVHRVPTQLHPRWDSNVHGKIETEQLGISRGAVPGKAYPARRVFPSVGGCGSSGSAGRLEVDWEGDDVVDFSLACSEYLLRERRDGLHWLFHDFEQPGFFTPTVVTYVDAQPQVREIGLVNLDPLGVERDPRGLPTERRVDGPVFVPEVR